MKSIRRVEFDEDSIQATSPIRNARPTDNKTLSIRTVHRSDSQETIMPTPRRTRSTDVFKPAVDETHNICKSSSTDEGSPGRKGTHLLRKSTSMENVSPTLSPTIRRMRSAFSIKPSTSPIRNARPMDIEIPSIRTLHRSDSQETIIPTPHRTWSKDDFRLQSLVSPSPSPWEKKILTNLPVARDPQRHPLLGI